MTLFVGVKMDEESTETIYQWLCRCFNPLELHPTPKKFLYLPIAYSFSKEVDQDLGQHAAGPIDITVKLEKPLIKVLGETGNVSLIFENEWMTERNQWWVDQDKRMKLKSSKNKYTHQNRTFVPRIPMSHSAGCVNHSWLKDLPIRKVRLVEEFWTDFDRRAFLKQVEEASQ